MASDASAADRCVELEREVSHLRQILQHAQDEIDKLQNRRMEDARRLMPTIRFKTADGTIEIG